MLFKICFSQFLTTGISSQKPDLKRHHHSMCICNSTQKFNLWIGWSYRLRCLIHSHQGHVTDFSVSALIPSADHFSSIPSWSCPQLRVIQRSGRVKDKVSATLSCRWKEKKTTWCGLALLKYHLDFQSSHIFITLYLLGCLWAKHSLWKSFSHQCGWLLCLNKVCYRCT